MTTVYAEIVGDKLLVSRIGLEQLVELAKRTEPVKLQIISSDVSTRDLMRLSENGGSFDFWADPKVVNYSANDGKSL